MVWFTASWPICKKCVCNHMLFIEVPALNTRDCNPLVICDILTRSDLLALNRFYFVWYRAILPITRKVPVAIIWELLLWGNEYFVLQLHYYFISILQSFAWLLLKCDDFRNKFLTREENLRLSTFAFFCGDRDTTLFLRKFLNGDYKNTMSMLYSYSLNNN